MTFRHLALDAQSKDQQDLSIAAHRKVLDYLTFSHIMRKNVSSKVPARLTMGSIKVIFEHTDIHP